ncbi:MAG: methionine synthase [Actinomycetota bacterium]|nr:methionine synthase [Actinomycetota bacterium]
MMAGLDFKPKCLATTIGSMPHVDPKRATEVIFTHTPDIPTWPQLPHLSFKESMAIQVSEGMPGVRLDEAKGTIHLDSGDLASRELELFYERFIEDDIDHFAISPEYAQGFEPFLQMVKEKGPSDISLLKGQLIGPISFGLTITDQSKAAVLYDDALRDAVIKTLIMKAKWQRKRFEGAAPDVESVIFFDEPYLQSYGSAYVKLNFDEVISYLNECFEGSGGPCGVHCCGRTDWGLLMETSVDIISFDAFDHTESLALYPKKIDTFLDRGGVLAFGIVPSTYPTPESIEDLTILTLLERFEGAVSLLAKKGIDEGKLLESALITPNCGTGSMSVPLAEKSIEFAGRLSQAVRAKYFGDEA